MNMFKCYNKGINEFHIGQKWQLCSQPHIQDTFNGMEFKFWKVFNRSTLFPETIPLWKKILEKLKFHTGKH
jgi:hypothetical protein